MPPPPFAKITENYFRLVPKVKYKRAKTSPSPRTLAADRFGAGAAVKAASKMSEEQEEMDLEFNSQAYNKP